MNSYQPQQNYNLQGYQERPFANNLELSPMMKSPLGKQKPNVSFTHQNNPRQFVNTPVKMGTYQFQINNDIKSEKKSLNQVMNKTPAVKENYVQQGKKFTPLSYKAEPKVVVQQEEKNKQYAKQTLKIVLVGFMILILLVGSFYSLILYDKMKNMESQNANQLSLTTNSTVVNGTVKIQTVSDKKSSNQQNQWKTLPQDEQSPLGFLQHQKAPQSNRRQPHLRTIRIQSTQHLTLQNPIHRRKFFL